MLIFPAHGALGGWDEIIFFVVLAIFIAMMVISWLRGQSLAESVESSEASDNNTHIESVDENRFELK